MRPKTIWLISDGKYPASSNEAITKANETVRAVINTVCIANESGQKRLGDLATHNGGTFHFVPSSDN
jgi:hypothetical protein